MKNTKHIILTVLSAVIILASLFTLNDEEQRIEIVLYTTSQMNASNYHSITFDTPKAFNNKAYKGIYVKDGNTIDVTKYAPNGTNGSYEINAWVLLGEVYLSMGDIKSVIINQAYVITPYVATKTSLFTFALSDSGAGITGYSGSSATVIFPRYAMIGSNYYVVTEIATLSDSSGSYSAFTGNTTIQTVVFNEGLKTIGTTAFKNCNSLKYVYFSNTVSSVASDAFYMDFSGTYETNRDVAVNIRFYIPSSNKVSTSDWLAAKHSASGKRYYGTKYKTFSHFLATGDFTNAFQTNNYTAYTKSLEIAKSL